MIDINNFNNLNINTTIVNFDFFPTFTPIKQTGQTLTTLTIKTLYMTANNLTNYLTINNNY